MSRIRVAIGIIAVLLASGYGAAVAGPSNGPSAVTHRHVDRWVMGYYPVYLRDRMPIGQIDWKAMTHIVIGPALPNADGSLNTDFDAYHAHPFVRRLASTARHHGVVPVLMIGGAGAHDGFAAAARDHRGRFVRKLITTMRHFGFAGLDLDWEPVSVGDQPALRSLVKALRRRAPHAVLTMPVGIVTTTFPHVPKLYGWLARRLDRINVMTYGMAGAYPGWRTWHSSALHGATPHTPSDVGFAVGRYVHAGVPAKRLGVGVGFYGTCWAGGVTRPGQEIGSSYVAADDNVMSFTNIMSTYYTASAYHYDTSAEAPYLSYRNGKGPQHCTFISYENQRSVAAKGAFAERRGLGSEIVWAINEGHLLGKHGTAGDPLLAAVRRSFH
ncbi:MAG: glycoside hydrolase family 18 protein [Frankiaceae bacterium]|nr:glycoside hydrolase family 18 protein [Frankiaceae bacterium]MBV9870984.1 glycoside hydrolase family 18 protein [Frankiaceae bacterium]